MLVIKKECRKVVEAFFRLATRWQKATPFTMFVYPRKNGVMFGMSNALSFVTLELPAEGDIEERMFRNPGAVSKVLKVTSGDIVLENAEDSLELMVGNSETWSLPDTDKRCEDDLLRFEPSKIRDDDFVIRLDGIDAAWIVNGADQVDDRRGYDRLFIDRDLKAVYCTDGKRMHVLKVHEKRIKRTTSLPVDMLLSLKAVTGRMDSTVFDRLRKIGKVKKTEKRDAGIVWEAGGIRFTTWESYNDTPPRGPDIDAILNVSRYDMEGTVLECGKVIKKVDAAKKISDAVWFEVKEGTLLLEMTKLNGEKVSTVRLEKIGTGTLRKRKLDPKYLQEALSGFNGEGGEIIIEAGNPGNDECCEGPVFIRHNDARQWRDGLVNGTGRLVAIMPMRK